MRSIRSKHSDLVAIHTQDSVSRNSLESQQQSLSGRELRELHNAHQNCSADRPVR